MSVAHVQPSEILAMTGEDLRFWLECVDEYRKKTEQVNNGES